MKPVPPVLRRLCASALFLSLSPFARADKADDWLKLLPEEALVVAVVKNTPEVRQDWEKSGISHFLEDEAVKRWMAPAYKDGKAPWEGDEVMGNLAENLNVTTGSMMVAFMAKSAAAMEKKQPDGIVLSEVAGKEAEHAALMAKELDAAQKKRANSKLTEDEIEGVKVHVHAVSDAKDADWINSWAVVDGVALQASNRAMMEYFIHALKDGNPGKPSGIVAGMGKTLEVNGGNADITLFVDLDRTVTLVKEAANAAAADNNKGAPMPFQPEMIIDALGFNELHGAAFCIDLQDATSRIDFVLSHDDSPKGIFPAIIRGTSTEVPQPEFIPADADSVNVSRNSLAKIYDALMAGLGKMGPMAAMVSMQLAQAEQQAGMSLRNDLLGSVDDTMVEIQDIGKGLLPNGEPDISKVDAFKLKDPERFKAALETVKKLIGNGFGVFDETDFQGYTIYSLKPSLPGGNASGDSKFSYTIAGDYLVAGTGKPDLMHRVLMRMKAPEGESFWANAEVQQSIAALPKGSSTIGAQRGGAIISAMAQMFGKMQSMAPGAKGKKTPAKKSSPKGPSTGEEDDDSASEGKANADGWFDPAAIPSEEVFNKHFGTSSIGAYALPDATQYRFIAQPPVAK